MHWHKSIRAHATTTAVEVLRQFPIFSTELCWSNMQQKLIEDYLSSDTDLS